METKSTESIFEKASRQTIKAPPFMETRVFARLDGRRQLRHQLAWWRRVAFVSASLCVVLVAYLLMSRSGTGLSRVMTAASPLASPYDGFEAKINVVTLVEVSVKDADATDIAKAEIELPDGVVFSYKKHPEVNDQRTLEVAWEENRNLGERDFPFVVRSTVPGIKKIKVRFLDKNNRVAQEKIMTIRFSS